MVWKRSLVSALALAAFSVAQEDYDYSTCPTGVSSADVVIGAGDMSLFETQEGDRYRPNVDCTFNYQMDTASCSQLTFECEEFVLRRGDYVYVTYGDNTKRFAWRNGGNPVRRSYAGDMTVRFTSDGSRQGPGAYCAVWCSREGSAPSTTASPAPTTSSSTPSPTTSTTQAPTTTEAPVPTTTTGSGSGSGGSSSSSGYTQQWLRGEGPAAHAHEGVRLSDKSGWVAIGEGLLDETNNQGVSRVLIRKVDNAAATVWSKQLGDTVTSGNAYSVGYSLAEAADGSALYAGVGLWSASSSKQEPAVVALNPSNGNVIWTKKLATSTSNHGGVRSCIVDGTDIVCVGYAAYAEPGFKFVADEGRPFVARLDKDGNVLTETLLTVEGAGQLAKIRKDPSGGFIACTTGWGELGGTDVNVVILVKFSATLAKEWEKSYGMAGGNSQVFDMLVDNDGNYLLGGHTTVGDGVVNWDYLALKVDSSTRNQVWRRTYGQPRNFDARYIHDEMYGVALDNNGNYLLLGGSGDEYTYSANGVGVWSGWKSDEWGSYLVVTSPSGDKLYENFYGLKGSNNAGEWLSYDKDTGDIMVYADSDAAGGFGFLKLSPA